MLATFLLPSAPRKIFCSPSVISDISVRQASLSEELFDAAEEHALRVLLDAWNDAAASDLSVFHKVGPEKNSIEPSPLLILLPRDATLARHSLMPRKHFSSRGYWRGCRACGRGCHEFATRKRVPWNLSLYCGRTSKNDVSMKEEWVQAGVTICNVGDGVGEGKCCDVTQGAQQQI